MASLIDEYLIPFHGLKEGIYDYEFDAGNDFFELFDNPDIKGGDVKINLNLNRGVRFLEFKFNITGFLVILCDRCLEYFNFKVDTENELIARFGEKHEEISDRVIMIPREETRFNVAQYIYEFLALSLPIQRIHPDDPDGSSGCDQEMITKLENLKPREKEKTDPRWDALKNVKFKK
ncbi:MAG: YceD family protein [Bacteroidota bacterium]